MMMVYGMFVFELRSMPYQQLKHKIGWRHVKNERVNRSAAWQYIGAGDTQITLNGALYPELTGGEKELALLATQAYTGYPWPLITGTGTIFGMYVLTALEATHTTFDPNGKARKIDFTASFQRCDEDLRERLQLSSVGDLLTDLKNKAMSAVNAAGSAVSGLY